MTCPYNPNCPQYDCGKLCNIEYSDCFLFADFEKYKREVEVVKEDGKLVKIIKKGLETIN